MDSPRKANRLNNEKEREVSHLGDDLIANVVYTGGGESPKEQLKSL
jgi:hypothetical protein